MKTGQIDPRGFETSGSIAVWLAYSLAFAGMRKAGFPQ
jgi:hypothetical protein